MMIGIAAAAKPDNTNGLRNVMYLEVITDEEG
jgi:hypothetical protein